MTRGRIILLCVLSVAINLFAQEPRKAPLPAPLLEAEKIYIVIGTNTHLTIYDAAYEQMRKFGHYKLASTPEDAELIFVFSQTSEQVGAYASGGVAQVFGNTVVQTSPSKVTPEYELAVHLTVLNARTGQLIWRQFTYQRLARKLKNRKKERALAVRRIINELKSRLPQ